MNINVLVLKYVQNCKSQLSLSSVMLLRKGVFNLFILLDYYCACWHRIGQQRYESNIILVPRARRFLVKWSGNEGLWKQPLPDVKPSGSGDENESNICSGIYWEVGTHYNVSCRQFVE